MNHEKELPSIYDIDPNLENDPRKQLTPLPVVQSVSPKPTFRRQDLGGAKHFMQTNNFDGATRLPSRIKYLCDNSGGAVAKIYDFFDPVGIVGNLVGGTRYQGVPSALTNAIVNLALASTEILFSGFRIEVTSSTAQFNNELIMYEGGLDGSMTKIPLFLEDAVEGDKYNEKIQSYHSNILINKFRMVSLNVDIAETVEITFFVKAMNV